MKIGIHHTKGSFSERWIAYCDEKHIDYKLVDCYRSDIVQQLEDCDALMWHFNHKGAKDSKFAKQLLYSIELSGKKVFPNYNTVWHFDDKVGQKYLLEAINAPLVPTFASYEKRESIEWAKIAGFPKVFKLRNGAGSDNVKLVKGQKQAIRLINKAFGRGFKQYESWNNLKERYRKYQEGQSSIWNVIKGIIRFVYPTEYARLTGREKGYVYFQDFIPDNDHDIRVVVIGEKAFAIKRMVRKGDFRASGSGFIAYGKDNFNNETIQLAFEISEKMRSQCMTYDFVYQNGHPYLVEISYGFAQEGYDACEGYWDQNLQWHMGQIYPQAWMVELIIE